jgi:hypothetical protein
MRRATYSHEFEQGVHVLVDLNEGASITNDVERVIRDLYSAGLDTSMPVIYRDSCGDYDRILVTPDGEFTAFLPLRTKDRAKAIRMVHSIAGLAKVGAS